MVLIRNLSIVSVITDNLFIKEFKLTDRSQNDLKV